MPRWTCWTALLTLLLVAACRTEEPEPVRLHDSGAPSLKLSNAIAEFLIEHGYERDVVLVPGTSRAVLQQLSAGEVDLTLEGWQQDALTWYEREIRSGRIENLGPSYEVGGRFLMIPRATSEELGITQISELRDHWEDFVDPRDASKGVIINCVAGSQCAELNRVRLQAYGLAGYFNLIEPSSYESLESTLERAQQLGLTIIGFYSDPGLVYETYDWQIVEEPRHSRECELALEAAAFEGGAVPSEGCGEVRASIDALAHAGLRDRAPEIAEMVERMELGRAQLLESLAWGKERGLRDDWEPAAIHYLEQNEDRWREWLTPEAYERVKAVLANLSPEAG